MLQQTRRKLLQIDTKTKGTQVPLTWQLPKTGILAGIYLVITGVVAGTLTDLNAFGNACIVSKVKLVANTGIELINISGQAFHYLARDLFEHLPDVGINTNARTALVEDAAINVSMFLPISLNARDDVGMFMLQNESTVLTLTVEFLANASIATGGTLTASVTPYLEIFTVPVDEKNWPPFNMVHTLIEETRVIADTSGEQKYDWPRGNTYLALVHGYGMAVSPTDKFTKYVLRLNQSDTLINVAPTGLDMEIARFRGRARLAGTIPIDFLMTTGLGNYATARDLLHSASLTDIESVITINAADTLYTVRRQLVSLG